MQVSKHIHMCVYTQIYRYICINIYTCTTFYICVQYIQYTNTNIYIYMYVCMYAYIYMYMYVIQLSIFTHVSIYIYTYSLIDLHILFTYLYTFVLTHAIHQLQGLAVRFRHRWQRQDLETLGWRWPVYGQMVVDPLVFFIRKTCGKAESDFSG